MEKAVFLDRDGVINFPVLNIKTGLYEAPFVPEDLKLFSNSVDALKKIQSLGFKLFLISNQPDYAKGKTNIENLKSVHNKLHEIFVENGVNFLQYFYCYHHPNGVIPELSIKCDCRKPGNLFLKKAKESFNIDLSISWIVGDRDTDIYCGQSLKLKTIQIKQIFPDEHAGKSKPDFRAKNLNEAVNIIEKENVCHTI